MIEPIKLSNLVNQIQETIQEQFEGEEFWVSAQITNVKKYETNRRCYLTLEEYHQKEKVAEVRAVFWANYYHEIEKFERITKQTFTNGIEIICKVKVRFHPVYGLNIDVVQIDVAHTLGSLELERQQTLERLVKENPKTIQLFDGAYHTFNNRLPIPMVIKNIALITAPHSDGQRDFLQELYKNKHGYTFQVKEFLTTIQGDQAHHLILEQLKEVEKIKDEIDIVAIVRGGGSQTDFKPFEDYELSRYVAHFPLPIYTGIGHDRNQSIVDLMAREQKTPTKVAAQFIEHNFEFENQLIDLKTRLLESITNQIQQAKDAVSHAKRIVKLASPEAILNRGFAIITQNDKIITDPKNININEEIKTLLKDEIIYSTVNKKEKK
jgi:exodeoxyribonuclease VII large subunit